MRAIFKAKDAERKKFCEDLDGERTGEFVPAGNQRSILEVPSVAILVFEGHLYEEMLRELSEMNEKIMIMI